MSYSKLHSSLVGSSLWSEPDSVRILFITLLAMCDRHGVVYGSRPGIDRLANIAAYDDDDDIDPWEVLLSPDIHSSDKLRNPENEGRRIEEVSGGFKLLNFEYYRGLRNDDDRREQNRAAQARLREKDKPASAKVSPDKPSSAKVSPRQTIPSASISASVSDKDNGKNKPKKEEEVVEYCRSIGLTEDDGKYFWSHWESNAFTVNERPMKDWKAVIRSWKAAKHCPSQKNGSLEFRL